MNKAVINVIACGATLLATLTTTGCKTVARENIISTINTGIGATLTENPQTQLYEVKLGFIRTQFYSVPTGKNVEGTNQANDACCTPEVVSGIRAHSGAEHLFIGMDVSESFAVGKKAVMSPAAVAMYVSQAKNPEAARDAALSVAAAQPLAAMKLQQQATTADSVLKHVTTEDGKLDKEKLKQLSKGTIWEPIVAAESDSLTLEGLKKHLDDDWTIMLDDLSKNLPK